MRLFISLRSQNGFKHDSGDLYFSVKNNGDVIGQEISDIDREVFDGYLRKARQVGRISLDSDDPQYVMTKLELADGDTLLN